MLKVLIAEDDLLNADMTDALLTDHGYQMCGIGRTVADALALAARHKPDLAILDVRLAGGDLGTQVAAELAEHRHLGILYVTANVAAVMSEGVRGHACLAKPYLPTDLLRGLQIVAGMIDAGTAIPPFPPGFRVLPPAGGLDSTDSDDSAARVKALRWQQSLLAEFGSYVLRQGELGSVLTEAVRVCAEGLQTAFCKLHRYRAAPQDDLLREATYGWHSDVTGHVVLPADVQSAEGRAFVTGAPVICNALRDSFGLNRPKSQAGRRLLSTLHVPIKGDHGRPYGVLGASNNTGQAYDRRDVDFLSRIADVVAASVAGFERTAILDQTVAELLVEIRAGQQQMRDQQPASHERSSARAADDAPPAIGKPGRPTSVPAANHEMYRDGLKAAHDVPAARRGADDPSQPHDASRRQPTCLDHRG